MKLDEIRAALTKHFRDNWPGEAPGDLALDRVEMPNHKFDRGPSDHFGRLSIVFQSRNNAAVGGARVRTRGLFFLQVFVPEDSGLKVAMHAGDAFAAIMDNAIVQATDGSSEFVHCYAVDTPSVGRRQGYHQTNYAVPFYADRET